MKDEVMTWLSNGADLPGGVRLYLKYVDNAPFRLLVSSVPDLVKEQLFDVLIRLSGVDDRVLVESCRRFFRPAGRVRIRDEWRFLSDRNCPSELKILAADKITAWGNYVAAHRSLSGCTSDKEFFETARIAVDSYIENDAIRREFAYYAEHGTVLGAHPVFAERRQLDELKSKGPVWLANRRGQLQHTIWRIRSVIASGDKPELKARREASLAAKERELSTIERLLEMYA